MQGDMICLIAFDFILWFVSAGMMDVPLVFHVSRMDFDDPAADMPGLGIPCNVVANLESVFHGIRTNAP